MAGMQGGAAECLICAHHLCCTTTPWKTTSPGMGEETGNHQAGHIHLLPYKRRNQLHRPVGSCKHSEDTLVMSMSPASSSTLINQVLRSRYSQQRKCMGIYSSTHSVSTRRSLESWRTRERRSATIGCNSDHRITRSDVSPSDTDYDVTQSTCQGATLI